jgi:MoxR-like ATPase
LADRQIITPSEDELLRKLEEARATALLHSSDYVVVSDVEAILRDALRHRLVLSYQALAEDVTADAILDDVIKVVKAPQIDFGRTAPQAA